MADPASRLVVLLHSRPVADLERGGRGLRLSFRGEYLDDEARVPLSLSLPAETGPHRGDDVGRWIDGLLPGRREVRERWRDHYGAASASAFDLLSTRVGHDCAGAVQFSAESGEGALWDRPRGVRWLSEEAFEDLILEMSRHPHWWGSSPSADGFSLAGAFPKTSLVRRGDGAWGRPYGTIPSTLILKPSTDDDPHQAVNEFLVMRTARHAGLACCDVELEVVAGCPVLIVSRFDRRTGGDGTVQRVHQEDLHQACGGGRSIYQSQGGLAPGEIAGFIKEHSAYPPRELEAFYHQLVYRWAAGDADGHAKNYTLLLTADDARLAPLYDSWSQPVRDPRHAMSHRMAMWVGDDGRLLAGDDESYWKDAANALGVRPRAAVRILSAVKDRFADAAEQAVSELPDDGIVEQPAERFRSFARSRS